MSRALIVVPTGTDLVAALQWPAGTPGLVRLSVSTGGDVWDTIRADAVRDRAAAVGYTALRMHRKVRQFLRDEARAVWASVILVWRFNVVTNAQTGGRWMLMGALGAGDYFHIRDSVGVVRVGLRTSMVAGDRPVEWQVAHAWSGVPDEQTSPEADG